MSQPAWRQLRSVRAPRVPGVVPMVEDPELLGSLVVPLLPVEDEPMLPLDPDEDPMPELPEVDPELPMLPELPLVLGVVVLELEPGVALELPMPPEEPLVEPLLPEAPMPPELVEPELSLEPVLPLVVPAEPAVPEPPVVAEGEEVVLAPPCPAPELPAAPLPEPAPPDWARAKPPKARAAAAATVVRVLLMVCMDGLLIEWPRWEAGWNERQWLAPAAGKRGGGPQPPPWADHGTGCRTGTGSGRRTQRAAGTAGAPA